MGLNAMEMGIARCWLLLGTCSAHIQGLGLMFAALRTESASSSEDYYGFLTTREAFFEMLFVIQT